MLAGGSTCWLLIAHSTLNVYYCRCLVIFQLASTDSSRYCDVPVPLISISATLAYMYILLLLSLSKSPWMFLAVVPCGTADVPQSIMNAKTIINLAGPSQFGDEQIGTRIHNVGVAKTTVLMYSSVCCLTMITCNSVPHRPTHVDRLMTVWANCALELGTTFNFDRICAHSEAQNELFALCTSISCLFLASFVYFSSYSSTYLHLQRINAFSQPTGAKMATESTALARPSLLYGP